MKYDADAIINLLEMYRVLRKENKQLDMEISKEMNKVYGSIKKSTGRKT